MAGERNQSFMKGAAILTASTLIVKVLGLLFSIPLANFISDQGMSYFYAAYDIFTWFLMISTAGLPIAVSRMVGTAWSQGRRAEADRVFSVSFSSCISGPTGWATCSWRRRAPGRPSGR